MDYSGPTHNSQASLPPVGEELNEQEQAQLIQHLEELKITLKDKAGQVAPVTFQEAEEDETQSGPYLKDQYPMISDWENYPAGPVGMAIRKIADTQEEIKENGREAGSRTRLRAEDWTSEAHLFIKKYEEDLITAKARDQKRQQEAAAYANRERRPEELHTSLAQLTLLEEQKKLIYPEDLAEELKGHPEALGRLSQAQEQLEKSYQGLTQKLGEATYGPVGELRQSIDKLEEALKEGQDDTAVRSLSRDLLGAVNQVKDAAQEYQKEVSRIRGNEDGPEDPDELWGRSEQ